MKNKPVKRALPGNLFLEIVKCTSKKNEPSFIPDLLQKYNLTKIIEVKKETQLSQLKSAGNDANDDEEITG